MATGWFTEKTETAQKEKEETDFINFSAKTIVLR